MNRLSKGELALTRSLVNSPFDDLIQVANVTPDTPVADRIDVLGRLLNGLKKLEKECHAVERTNATLSLSGMLLGGLAISSCATLGVIGAAVIPVLAGAGMIGLLGSAGTQQAKIMKLEKTSEQVRLAISSSPTVYWASLWKIAGTDLFLEAVEEAVDVTVVDGEISYKGDNPLTKAIDHVARCKGWRYEEVLDACEDLANEYTASIALPSSKRPQLPKQTVIPKPAPVFVETDVESIPTQLQEPFTRLQEQISQPSVIEMAKRSEKTKDIVDFILECVDSIVFIGGQRCGKSLLMAISSKIGLQRGRFNKVYSISSLAKQGEDPEYWAHCTKTQFFDLGDVVDKTDAYESFIVVIRDYLKNARDDNPCLLIVDEFYFLAQSLERDVKKKESEDLASAAKELMELLMNLCASLVSGGDKRGKYVWFGSPQGNINKLALMSNLTKLRVCFAAIAPGVEIPTITGSSVTWNVNLFDATARNWGELKNNEPPRNAKRDLSDRIVEFNGKWHPKTQFTLDSVELPQDQSKTRTAIAAKDALTPTERQGLNLAVATVKSQSDIVLGKLNTTSHIDLDDFIEQELGETRRVAEVKAQILSLLIKTQRNDLMKKFKLIS
jgi:FlaG/FlaF family flagellin (archaellin)